MGSPGRAKQKIQGGGVAAASDEVARSGLEIGNLRGRCCSLPRRHTVHLYHKNVQLSYNSTDSRDYETGRGGSGGSGRRLLLAQSSSNFSRTWTDAGLDRRPQGA